MLCVFKAYIYILSSLKNLNRSNQLVLKVLLGMTLEERTLIIHRLRSACGHLDSIVGMVEAGHPCESILHQLGAVQAAMREIGLAILEKEMMKTTEIILSSDIYEERLIATQRILELYEQLYKKPIQNFWSMRYDYDKSKP